MATFPGVVTEQGQGIEGGLRLLTWDGDANARDDYTTYPLVRLKTVREQSEEDNREAAEAQ